MSSAPAAEDAAAPKPAKKKPRLKLPDQPYFFAKTEKKRGSISAILAGQVETVEDVDARVREHEKDREMAAAIARVRANAGRRTASGARFASSGRSKRVQALAEAAARAAESKADPVIFCRVDFMQRLRALVNLQQSTATASSNGVAASSGASCGKPMSAREQAEAKEAARVAAEAEAAEKAAAAVKAARRRRKARISKLHKDIESMREKMASNEAELALLVAEQEEDEKKGGRGSSEGSGGSG